MPKAKKTKSASDDYIPLESESRGHGIEIPVKPEPELKDLMTIEKSGEESGKQNTTSTIKKKSAIKRKTEKIPEYTLIITEKPQAALKIASALGNARKLSEQGVPYYELIRDNKKIIVACAVGHLFTLATEEKGWPIFKIKWQPNFKVRKKDFSKKYYTTLLRLCKDASNFIIATDYDIEGEVIGLNIIRYIAKQKDAKRMKFSTLTTDELNNSFENPEQTLNWGQAIAGETRHILDWYYGINLSRALMSAIKSQGKFKIMSIGRVQGPALKLVVDKEKSILVFKPQPYWEVFIELDKYKDILLKYIERITKKTELSKFEKLKSKEAEASTEKSSQILVPLPPFDLTTLQIEAYKFYNINPARTLQIAQNLYLAGLISYPRTSSQKLPLSINYKKILEKIKEKFNFKNLTRAKPIEGKKIDPAHPSIYPTGEFSDLPEEERKIYELVVKRFAACFAEDAELANKKIKVNVEIEIEIADKTRNKKKENLIFEAKGLEILKKGWLDIYPLRFKEIELPDINGTVKIKKVNIEEKETQPPKRYTQASIISELEKKNLGTKATRASIIETLYTRGYIQEQSIKATPLGISLIETLEKYSPVIIDEKLTRYFEKQMNSIQTAKTNLEKKEEKILEEAKKQIIEISQDFLKKQDKIGKELVSAQEKNWENEKANNTLQKCPVCNKGDLRILFNKAYRRYFVACNNYPECKTTFSLPPNSLIKKSDKVCEVCGFQKLLAIRKGKKPWEFCFNPNCASRKQNSEGKEEEKES